MQEAEDFDVQPPGDLGGGGIAVGHGCAGDGVCYLGFAARQFLDENGDRRVGAAAGRRRIIRPHWGSLFLSPARFADEQVKCTHDGSFITASLLAPHAGGRSRSHAGLHPANPAAPAADRRPFAEDVRLGAADERVSHYSLLSGR
jgi:hypothetical protein